MEIRTVINRVYKGRKVNEIAKVGLEGQEDIIMLFRELKNSYPNELWKDAGEDKIVDYIRCFESDTDRIAKGEERYNFSKEELEEQAAYEKHCLDSDKEEIKELFIYLSKVDF